MLLLVKRADNSLTGGGTVNIEVDISEQKYIRNVQVLFFFKNLMLCINV